MQLLQISNRLSLLHSNMALILLKMNNLSGAEILLSKSNSYISEQLTHIIKKLDKKFKFDKSIADAQMFIQEKNDSKNLIYRESLEEFIKSRRSKINDVYENTDDGGSFEAKFHYLFISGLFEVQKMNFVMANQMQFYNPRRAELYLRKALYIREKDRQDFFYGQDVQKSVNAFSNSSSFFTSRSSNDSHLQLFQNSSEFNSNSQNKKLNTNDDQNQLAEILFDLGGLLSNFDSIISKKEALECLRRSLDIKILIFGSNHDDCLIIKNKLNEILSQIARQQLAQQQQHEILSPTMTRETMSMLGYQKTSNSLKSHSVLQLKKNLENLNKNQKRFFSPQITANNDLDDWIHRNSVLETINRPKLARRSESELELKREADVKSVQIIVPNENTKIERLKKQQKIFEKPRAQSNGYEKEKSRTNIHKQNCKCPTSLSIDSNNEKYSVNGRNSSLKNLLLKNDDLRLKIAKKIYYKSAWYDLPHGSNQNRFKRFVKLTPNA
ncbi:unnamed protein product [Brachionus calyciflorus]|uniref:Uncharacterized protein n=1 Tax=Brachionus calyciflorus TaxID=104777 RepID=A0A814G6Q6_9BILA|nr:unnamed protein product [Brachionus calyciflorus]